VLGLVGEIIGDADAGNARREQGLVGDTADPAAINEDARLIAAQRLAIIGGVHEHGVFLRQQGFFLNQAWKVKRLVRASRST
jgi:hypothetical protein